ncbi:tyrosine protein kinase [Nocardiopsis sp. MG754419]|nr:tyrosine protein kinase [Nocardiopsis sp. MG754419]
MHGWAGLVVFAATGTPPFGPSPAGHVPGRVPGQIVWEMAARARRAHVDLSALPEGLRPLLERAFSPDPDRRPSAEEAYLECLLLLGIDERATADTWPDRLRALIAEHWPTLDLSWHDPVAWTDAALALAEQRRAGAEPREQDGSRPASAAAGPVPPMPPRRLEAPAGQGAPPGLRGPGAAVDRGSDAGAYLFGGRGGPAGEHPTAEIRLDEDDETAGGPRLGLWLGVGAAGMALVLGGGYLLYNALGDAPADTVVAEERTQEPGSGDAEEEAEPEPATPEPLACDDSERMSAQEARAQWRPFDPAAAGTEVYLDLLTPAPEGVAVVDPEIWPFAYPVDHDTADFGLATPSLAAFPVLTVCMTEAVPASDGIEFSVQVRYHPDVGSHHVYAEDFLTLTPIDPAENDGVDKVVHRGGTGSELAAPLTTLAVLGPGRPTEELTVFIPGAPERAGVAYRPAAHAGPLVHEMSGHCYDVDGTLEWRDEEMLGSGFFAVPDTALESNSMMNCPVGEGDTDGEG